MRISRAGMRPISPQADAASPQADDEIPSDIVQINQVVVAGEFYHGDSVNSSWVSKSLLLDDVGLAHIRQGASFSV